MIKYKEEGEGRIFKGIKKALKEDLPPSPTTKKVKQLDLNQLSLQESKIIEETEKQLIFLSADDISIVMLLFFSLLMKI